MLHLFTTCSRQNCAVQLVLLAVLLSAKIDHLIGAIIENMSENKHHESFPQN